MMDEQEMSLGNFQERANIISEFPDCLTGRMVKAFVKSNGVHDKEKITALP